MEMKEKLFIASKIYQSIPIYFAHWENSFIKKDELDSALEGLKSQLLIDQLLRQKV